MITGNYFTDNQDLMIHFDGIIRWDEIVRSYEYDFSDAKKADTDERYAMAPASTEEAIDYYRSLLTQIGDFAGNKIAPAAADMDKTGARFENGKVVLPQTLLDLVEDARQAGLQPTGISRKWGGLGVPWTVRSAATEILYRADTSTTIAIGCVNLAEIIEAHGSDELQQAWLPGLAAGNYACAMCLTEPDHGSDLPNIRTRAEKNPDGSYKLNGTKRFITQGCGTGDKPAVLLVLARTGGPGARGLSFFLVNSNDAQIAGIEKKMGLHASPTCEIVFENTPGLLIGQEGMGLLRYTMGMLNGARMGIAQQATGMATAALEEAKSFAKIRLQFDRPIEQLPAISEILSRCEREILAMRCLIFESARCMDLYFWRRGHLVKQGATPSDLKSDIVIKYWEKLAGVLTPVSKYYCSETALKIISDCLQVHGGSGFTEDYDIARIYRDARIMTLYDGTSQIQVNAAIGQVITGMSETGFLREYIESEWTGLDSAQYFGFDELYKQFEDITTSFRDITKPGKKEAYSDLVVMAAARLLSSMLFVKSIGRLGKNTTPEQLQARQEHARDHVIDSLAVTRGILIKIQSAL